MTYLINSIIIGMKANKSNKMARSQKVKPHFIVFYHDLKHPLREPWNTRTTPYEIWKEYHDDMIFDAPYYRILGYFDTRQEAKQFVQQHKLQEV